MELFTSKRQNSQLFTYLKEAIKNNNCEFEFIHGSHPNNYPLNREQFIRILKELKQKYNSTVESNTLDIVERNSNNIRVTIYGIENIKKYCRNNSLDDISNLSFMEKTKYKNSQLSPHLKFESIINHDYNFRINVKQEDFLDITDHRVQILLSDWKNKYKSFRYKKRYSFITKDNLFRIDMTAVKSTKYKEYFKTFLDSNVLKNQETFELEVEYIGSNKIDNKFPIDLYKEKIALKPPPKNPYENMEPIKLEGINDESDFLYPDLSLEDDLYKDIPPGINEGEFVEAVIYYPHQIANKVTDVSSFEDIKYEYWEETGKEWLFEAILMYNKTVSYMGKLTNYTADYENSPKNTDYTKYEIYPDFTIKEKEEIEELDDNYTNILFVPEEKIVRITKIKDISWAPGKKKDKKLKKPELEINDLPEIIIDEEQIRKNKEFVEDPNQEGPTYSPGNPRETDFDLRDTYKWSPEPKSYNPDEKIPLITFEQLKEAGEFDEDIKGQQSVFEYKQKNKKPENLNDVTHGLIDVLSEIVKEIIILKENNRIIIPHGDKERIIKEYRALTEQRNSQYITKKKRELTHLFKKEKKEDKDTRKENYLKREIKKLEIDTTNFIGPNPVSMSLNDVNIKNNHSIYEAYVVTEKADGIRAQLFIGSDNIGYLITQKMKIIGTNIHFKGTNGTWLFDGEYITKNINNEDIELFMIFDVYYADDGKSKYPSHAFTYPWISHKKDDISRYNIIQEFQKQVEIDTTNSTFRIGFKNYLEGPKKLQKSKKDPNKFSNMSGILKQSKKILDLSKKRGYEYNIDGLIYMPMFLSVRSMEEGSSNNFIGGEWSINYKWKPPEENTIDFKVRFVKEEVNKIMKDKIISTRVNGKTIICKQVLLYVGYSIKKDKDYDFTIDILENKSTNSLKEILFNPDKDNKTLYTCNIPLSGNKLLCEKDGSEILDESIVEMKYNPDSKEMSWIPLRVRFDKVKPQFFIAANNIWNTIINPVTENMIMGVEDIEIEDIKSQYEEHSYYVGAEDESKMDEPLRKLHNFIKSKLIAAVCSLGNKSISIMDTSIGRGGDIKKYLFSKNPIDFLFALDISPDVRKATHIYQMEYSKKPKALFMQYDTSESIMNGAGFKGSDEIIERNKNLIDIVYDKKKNISKKYEIIEKSYRRIAKKKFDIISSQFSVHYYFKDEITLRGYLQNLSDNCEKGGYFIGTCYDGVKVFNELKENGIIEMFDYYNNKVYSIDKNYEIDDFTYEKDNKAKMFGQIINVYMSSIGLEVPEYLVNFDFFKDIMKEYRFKLVTPNFRGINRGIFDNQKYLLEDGLGSFEQIINNIDKIAEKDPLIKKSLQNELVKGPYYKALEINNVQYEKLKVLSSFNNWFIFQKY